MAKWDKNTELHIYLCIWISVIRCITGLISEKLFGVFFYLSCFFKTLWFTRVFRALILTTPPSALCFPALHPTRVRRSLSSAGRYPGRRGISCPVLAHTPCFHPLFHPACASPFSMAVGESRPHIKPSLSQPNSALHWQPHCSVLLSFWIFQEMRKYSHAKL